MVKKATHSEIKKTVLSEPFKDRSEIHKSIHGFPRQVSVGCYSQPRLHLTALTYIAISVF